MFSSGVTRFRKGIVAICLTLVFSLMLNTTVVTAKQKGQPSFNKNTPVNAAAWKNFKEEKIVKEMLKDSDLKGHKLNLETPMFAELSSGKIAVTVGGHQGDGKVVLITGYFDPATKSMSYGHAMYFEQQTDKKIRTEMTVHVQGAVSKRNGLLFDPAKKEWMTEDGKALPGGHGDEQKTRLVFGGVALADHEPPPCQTLECEMTYEFFGMLVCGLIGLLTGGFGFFLCETIWQPLVKYVCYEVIYPYCQ